LAILLILDVALISGDILVSVRKIILDDSQRLEIIAEGLLSGRFGEMAGERINPDNQNDA
jgi:hypothetical protein